MGGSIWPPTLSSSPEEENSNINHQFSHLPCFVSHDCILLRHRNVYIYLFHSQLVWTEKVFKAATQTSSEFLLFCNTKPLIWLICFNIFLHKTLPFAGRHATSQRERARNGNEVPSLPLLRNLRVGFKDLFLKLVNSAEFPPKKVNGCHSCIL